MMKTLCFAIYDFSVGGVNKVVERLSSRLVENYKVYIVSLHGTEIDAALQFDPKVIIQCFDMKENRLRDQMLQAVPKLLRFFRKNHVDICFLEATYMGFIGSPLSLFSKTKVVFCDHGALANQLDDSDITRMRKIASRLCDKTVVLTQRNMNDYIQLFNMKPRKIVNIYNWINKSMICDNIVYNISTKRILTAGRISKEKGFDLLIKVAELVLPENPDWEWHIYGDGTLKEQLANAIVSNNLQNQIIMHGFSNNMDQVYRDTAIYVLPSYREGIPLVLLEAKAYKVPCVSFDIVSGPNEIISDGVNGALIEPYNISQMAKALNALIKDPALREQYSNNAYLDIEKYSEEIVLSQWKSLITELVGME